MHQSFKTPGPRAPGHSGGLTRPKPGFNALLMACRPRGVCKPGPWGGDLTAHGITGSGDSSRDLTRKTEGRAITKVMGGDGKKSHAREGA